jgi:hypothetical protein
MGLPLMAPIPPLALLGREQRVAGLRYGRGEDVLAADVDALAGNAAELSIEPGRVLPGELCNVTDAEKLEVAQHGRANGDQVLKMSLWDWHGFLRLTMAVTMLYRALV